MRATRTVFESDCARESRSRSEENARKCTHVTNSDNERAACCAVKCRNQSKREWRL